MDKLREAARGVAKELARGIGQRTVLGLGSGSTVAALLEELSPLARKKGTRLRGVATSTQIEMVASECEIELVPFRGSVDLVVDGADQVDEQLNLIKGGGGALLKEKVVMSAAKRVAIVAGEAKFARRLCEKGVKVPVEVAPIARESARKGLRKLGGRPAERLLPKGYPYYTENGNVVLDTGFAPVSDPAALEVAIKRIPGVMEAGIFTVKPLTVYRLGADGGFEALKRLA